MSQADFWYVRFPDGRVLRAASTSVLRQELSARHIPLGSTVRRSPSDEWVSLEWTQEFADLVEEVMARERRDAQTTRASGATPISSAPLRWENAATNHTATVGSRLDPARLHLVGVRSYFDELLAALDSALVPKKLLLGLCAGLLLGVVLVSLRAVWFEPEGTWSTPTWLLLAACLLVFDGLVALLTRLTYVELARLRLARWREGLNGVGRSTVWVVVSQLIVCGIVGALIVFLRWLPFWLGPASDDTWSNGQRLLASSALALEMLVEVVLYSVFVFWWLLPPLLVVEDCTVWAGLQRWLSLLRRHLGRVFLYQTMAVASGLLVIAPFLMLIAPLFVPSFYVPEELQQAARGMRCFLLGLASGPLLVYWITSNVFIYLNLRYGAGGSR